MKTIIAGSRSVTDFKIVNQAIKNSGFSISEVVSGCARGVDRLGEGWAGEAGIKVARFPAEWDTHGKAAGVIRNREMARYADALVAVWDGKSRGTKNMIETARECGLDVYVEVVK